MKINDYKLYSYRKNNNFKPIPFLLSKVQAGTPFDFDDFIEEKVDLNELLIKEPNSTYFMRVDKSSAVNNEIVPGSLLIVDRDKDPENMDIVVAIMNGELFVSRIKINNKGIRLERLNGEIVKNGPDFEVWGVVTYSIKSI